MAKPLCPYIGKCGGCSFQDVDHAEQLESKSIVHITSDKAHVVAELSRRDSSGQLFASLSGLYLVTNLQDQWGVIGRFEFDTSPINKYSSIAYQKEKQWQ